jgi:hypothetical protein
MLVSWIGTHVRKKEKKKLNKIKERRKERDKIIGKG